MTGAGEPTPSLHALLDAFNAHDTDAVLSFFTDDCVFDMPRGPAPGGQRLVGKQEVRRGIQARFDGIPDIHYGDDRHWTCGDRGVSSGRSAAPGRPESRSRSAGATCSSSGTARSVARTRSGRSSTDPAGAGRRSRQLVSSSIAP